MVLKPTSIVMNQVTPVAQVTLVTFGHVKIQIYIDIYNTRISYPTLIIPIALADVKACFRFTRIHVDLTGAFGFFADDLYNFATAMVFGSTVSASSWESFRQVIEALTKVFAYRTDLVIKHKKYLDMLKWEEIDHSTKKVHAFPCAINQGIVDGARKQINLPARALMLATSVEHMKMALVAMIKAILW
jgi:hypothetical protein